MDLYILIAQFFFYGNAIIQVVILLFLFIQFIGLLIQKILFKVAMHSDYFYLTRKIEKTRKNIENKSKQGQKTESEQVILNMYIQNREQEVKEYKVPFTGIKKATFMTISHLTHFLIQLNLVKTIGKFYSGIRKAIINKYDLIPRNVKVIFFFTSIYLQAEATWCVIYLAIYKKISFPFDLDLSYLPFMLLAFVISNSVNNSIRLKSFKKNNTSIETTYFFKKALVFFEAGLPLLTVSTLIGTVIGFSHHNLQYSLLQFFMLIFSPLIPLIFSLKFNLVEKGNEITPNSKIDNLN